jgi:hypothetical protein
MTRERVSSSRRTRSSSTTFRSSTSSSPSSRSAYRPPHQQRTHALNLINGAFAHSLARTLAQIALNSLTHALNTALMSRGRLIHHSHTDPLPHSLVRPLAVPANRSQPHCHLLNTLINTRILSSMHPLINTSSTHSLTHAHHLNSLTGTFPSCPTTSTQRLSLARFRTPRTLNTGSGTRTSTSACCATRPSTV